MNNQKSHFELHPRFQNGIFILAIVLFLGVVFYWWLTFYRNERQPLKLEVLSEYQAKIDSLKQVTTTSKSKKESLKPFNPNFTTDYKGYLLGLKLDEIDSIIKYRSEGKWINSMADFSKVTGIKGSRLDSISIYFKFPEWVNQKRSTGNITSKSNFSSIPFDKKKDLNTVTAGELSAELNIPDFIAERIINYRNSLGGYISDIQLKDVKGLYSNTYSKILSHYTVKSGKSIDRININKASVKQLSDIPYFDFETAIEIIDYIKANGEVSSFEELGKIQGFSLEKIDRIALYLTLK